MRNVYIMVLFLALFGCGEKKPAVLKPPTDGVHYEGDSVNFVKYLYKDGIMMSETPFVDNKAHGLSKDYYANGKIRLTVEYKNAKRDGLTTSYYDTGEKHAETPYKDGKVEGTKYMYKKDGSLTMKGNYVDGKPIPPIEEFELDGKPVAQPSIVFKTSGGILNMELNNKSYTAPKFYQITNFGLVEIPMKGNIGSLQATKGITVRAYYKTPRGIDGAIDAKY